MREAWSPYGTGKDRHHFSHIFSFQYGYYETTANSDKGKWEHGWERWLITKLANKQASGYHTSTVAFSNRFCVVGKTGWVLIGDWLIDWSQLRWPRSAKTPQGSAALRPSTYLLVWFFFVICQRSCRRWVTCVELNWSELNSMANPFSLHLYISYTLYSTGSGALWVGAPHSRAPDRGIDKIFRRSYFRYGKSRTQPWLHRRGVRWLQCLTCSGMFDISSNHSFRFVSKLRTKTY